MIGAQSSRTRRLARRGVQIGAALIGLLVVAVVAISILPDSAWQRWIASALAHKTGRAVAIDGPVQVRLLRLTPSISIDGFRLQNAAWADSRPMLQIRHFEASLRLSSLLRLHPVFARVRIDAPDIDLERDAKSRANWDFSSAGATQPAPPKPSAPLRLPPIQELVLTEGKLSANDAIRKLKFHGQISIAERAEQLGDSALKVRGTGTLNAKPFDLKWSGGPLLALDEGKPYEFDAAVTAADIELNAHTVIERAFDLGSVDSTFHLRGKDLADLYYLTGLALPNTPAYEVTGTMHRDQWKFSVDDLKGRLGRSDIGGKLSIDADRERPLLRAELTSARLDLADLAVPLGTQASSEHTSGTLAPPQQGGESVNPRSHGARARPAVSAVDRQSKETGYLLPDADLQVNRVRAMDADVRFEAAAIAAGKMPMKKVRFHLLLKDGHLQLAPLEFTLPQGEFAGSISIDARQAVPVTDLDMRSEEASCRER